jgi:hypothetical protein
MRLAYPVVLLVLCITVGSMWFSMHLGAEPTAEAQTFMKDIQEGRVVHAVKQFGSNVCHCPAKGGWVSYLIYQSGQEHNLAFMLGRPFILGAPHAAPVETEAPGLLPWEHPEDYIVDYPVHFDAATYEPYFLPLPMAYGKDMSTKEFEDFLKDPDHDSWKGFTLRLRPGLSPGDITPPAIEVPPEIKDQFVSYLRAQQVETDASKSNTKNKKDDKDAEINEAYMRKMFGDEATEYLKPQDAGHVLNEQGKPLSEKEVASRLPRLKDMTLRLHVVRRGKMQPWTIYHFALEHPILVTPDGTELALTHHQRPKSSPTKGTEKVKAEE